jgi:MFS family permease
MLILYVVSLGILWPVGRARGRETATRSDHGLRFLKSPRALRLVPAWVAVNGVLGVWLTHAAHQLKKVDDPTQLLVGGFTGSEISRFGGITLVLFVVGIGVWGVIMGRIGSVRTMILSLAGLVALCPALFILNHSQGRGELRIGVLIAIAGAALLVTSGFTPAALAYLSKIAEEFAEQRGAIMGLYSVLLGVGQALGGALGGIGADWRGADGLIAASILFTACAIVAVTGLARTERALGTQADAHRRLVKEPVGVSRH